MSIQESTEQQIADDIWAWIHEFVAAKSAFYVYKFAPCPFAQKALAAGSVDVRVWSSGDVRAFIRAGAIEMRDTPTLTTRVMVFPPRTQFQWGLGEFVESLNTELISTNVFLNTGVAQSTHSRYAASRESDPYFIVVANSLDAVLAGSEALMKTDYYKDWPADHFALVVERRARLAGLYGRGPAQRVAQGPATS